MTTPSAGYPRIVIETSGRIGSVAIDRGDGHDPKIVERTFSSDLAHGRELFPVIDDLTSELGIAPADVRAVAISVGPGSYTGVRIGVSAAKSIAWASSIPVIAVSSIAALARNVCREDAVPDGETFSIIGDARRGSAYHARFRRADCTPVRLESDQIVSVEGATPQDPYVLAIAGKILEPWTGVTRIDARCETPLARSVAELAHLAEPGLAEEARHRIVEIADPHTLAPTYLRPSEAEEKRIERERAATEGEG